MPFNDLADAEAWLELAKLFNADDRTQRFADVQKKLKEGKKPTDMHILALFNERVFNVQKWYTKREKRLHAS